MGELLMQLYFESGGSSIPARTPYGRTRREFLWEAGGGFAGVALTALLSADGFFQQTARAAETASKGDSPLMPRRPHHAARAKAVICLFMYGGVSQVDTWDPKPELNKHNGKPMPNLDRDPLFKARKPGVLLGSPRKFQKHGQSGIEVSDFFPHLARRVDDLAVIRGTYTDSFAHGSGLLQMNTGYLRQGYPCLGSWVSYGLGTVNQNLPAFVVLLDQRGGPISGPPNWGAGFMPAAHQGTQLRVSGEPILYLSPPAGVSTAQQRNQLDLLNEFNRRHQQATPDNSELAARIASYELAFRMQAAAPELIDLSGESEKTLEAYGVNREDPPMKAERGGGPGQYRAFATNCLLARRLVERGVRFVNIIHASWDHHSNLDNELGFNAGMADRPIAALIKDLKQRGLLDETLVVWGSEFGRTPLGENRAGRTGVTGRDHHPYAFSMFMAGGGSKPGTTYGQTDDIGWNITKDPIHINDFHATLLNLFGLDHLKLTHRFQGRDFRLTDVAGNVLPGLIA
jgi:hypothetical protein